MSPFVAHAFKSTFRGLLIFFLLLFGVWANAADGGLDTAFGIGGKVTTAVGAAADQVNAVVQQPDGKLVVAGFSHNGSDNDFALARYNADGSLDTTFGSGGKVITAVGTKDDVANALLRQSDGKLVAAGYSGNSSNIAKFALVRYNTDGSLDSTFRGTGKVTTPISSSSYYRDSIQSVIQQSDGKLVVAGWSGDDVGNESFPDFTVVRYNLNGTLDTTFNVTGIVITSIGSSEYAYSIIQQSDGKLVVAGGSGGANPMMELVRYNNNGTLDTTFNVTGKVVTTVGTKGTFAAKSVVQQNDGKIVVAGSVCVTTFIGCSNADILLVRYNGDGSLDTTFGTGGSVATAVGSGNDYATAMVMDGSKFLVAGYSNNGSNDDFSLLRYNANGSLDTTFGASGIVRTPIGSGADRANALLLQSDKKIVAAGFSYNGSDNDFALVRIDSAGLSNDTDNDGVINTSDNCPIISNASQADADQDGIGNACDTTPYNEIDTDKDTLPDDWETAHGRNPNVADYTIYTQYVSSISSYAVCAKDDAGTRCWDFSGNFLGITPFTSNDYSRPALISGTCDLGSGYPFQEGTCTGVLPQYAATVSCKYYDAATDYVLCDSVCSGYVHENTYFGGQLQYCSNAPRTVNYPIGDSNARICHFDAGGFKCYAVEPLYGKQKGEPLNIPINFTIDSDGDGSARPGDPDDLDPAVTSSNVNDVDGDGILDAVDNCTAISNTNQLDTDGDTYGNACDSDDDNDGVADTTDKFPLTAAASLDSDNDGYPNSWNASCDSACQASSGLVLDNCPSTSNTNQLNTDSDSQGNACDSDDDDDGVADASDAFPLNPAESADSDSDGIGNNIDTDDDNDGLDDISDNCPTVFNPDQLNTDGDAQGNACDNDNDNDGVVDGSDTWPFDPAEAYDTDNDGIGNNADLDDDNDGLADIEEVALGTNPLVADTDGDTFNDNNDAFPNDSCAITDTDHDGKPDKLYCYRLVLTGISGYVSKAITLLSPQRVTGPAAFNDGAHQLRVSHTNNTLLPAGAHNLWMDLSYLCAGGACIQSLTFTMAVGSTTLVEDDDDDDDGFVDGSDNCRLVSNADQLDTDADGVGDVCDTTPNGDSDNDGVDNATDNCVSVSNANQLDTDADGVGDVCDLYPQNALYSADTDRDTLPDNWETANGRDPAKADYAVSVAYSHACTLDEEGIKCWGSNNKGQLNVPATLQNPYAITTGTEWSCACDDNGSQCWGNGYPATPSCAVSTTGATASLLYNGLGFCNANPPPAQVAQAPGFNVQSSCSINGSGDVFCNTSGTYKTYPLTIPQPYQCVWTTSNITGEDKTFSPGNVRQLSQYDKRLCMLSDKGIECFELSASEGDVPLTTVSATNFAPATLVIDSDNDGVPRPVDTNDLDASFAGDTDSDGVDALTDNCPSVSNADQLNTDGDSEGNACDNDDDNDNIVDASDAFPLHIEATIDTDGDGKPDKIDTLKLPVFNDFESGTGNGWTLTTYYPAVTNWGLATNYSVSPSHSLQLTAYRDVSHSTNVASLEITLETGSSISWYLRGESSIGIYRVKVDGAYAGACTPSGAWSFCVAQVSPGTHTFALEANSGTPPMTGSYAKIFIDDLRIGSTLIEDADDDNDGVADDSDTFPLDATESVDTDGDGIGNNADATPNGDSDNDGVDNAADNCVSVSNADQLNTDGDSEGNACDNDDDNDGVLDASDAFPLDASESIDTDGDGIGNNADTTPNGDTDNDGVDNNLDNCVSVSNADQLNIDGDAFGDSCDTTPNGDTDGDGVDNNSDNCVSVSNADQLNTDGDAFGDACDTTPNGDTDGDGVDNESDNCPTVSNADQIDIDADGAGDVCDLFPLDDTLLLEQNGAAKNENFASSIAMADMNNDGVVDVLVGAPMANVSVDGKTLKKAGVIRIISGADNSIFNTLNGTAANQQFGTAIAVVDDQNSDGVPDVVVGEPLADITTVLPKIRKLKNAGRVAVYSGSDGALLNVITKGSKKGDHFGASVAVGDVNNDAQNDLVVGAPMSNAVAKNSGQVTVFNGLSSTVLYQRNGDQAGENFGAAVAVDQQRLLVGSPQFDSATINNVGRVSIFNSNEGSGAALLTVGGSAKGDAFGAAISAANDDWAVGIPLSDVTAKDAGSVQVFSGLNIAPSATLIGSNVGDNYGSAVNMQGDVNKDGKNDLAIGAAKFDVSTQVEKRKSAGMKTVLLKDAGRVEVLSGAAL